MLVPLPIATRDHQTANARVLVDAGAAVLVPDAELDGATARAELDAICSPTRDVAARRWPRHAAAPRAAPRRGRIAWPLVVEEPRVP